jgi:8-oxo-dGTP pyrophosphatase MutT (NUDIX family)
MQLFHQKLSDRLSKELPGIQAQMKMVHKLSKIEGPNSRFRVPEQHKKASVLTLLYPKQEEWHFALMQRPESPYPHSRQISLPGGRFEEQDPDESYTALRETEEEFGIPQTSIKLVGKMTEVYIPVSNFLVYPFIGIIEETPAFIPDPTEVEEIIEVSIKDLMNSENRKKADLQIHTDLTLEEVPHFYFSNKIIWGATAMILSELAEILEDIKL